MPGRRSTGTSARPAISPTAAARSKLAATLIGSALALGPAEIPARILLHGKEGPIGLMPPVGQVFTDEQIAAVLTYIRREWGQRGAPVDEATVKACEPPLPAGPGPGRMTSSTCSSVPAGAAGEPRGQSSGATQRQAPMEEATDAQPEAPRGGRRALAEDHGGASRSPGT